MVYARRLSSVARAIFGLTSILCALICAIWILSLCRWSDVALRRFFGVSTAISTCQKQVFPIGTNRLTVPGLYISLFLQPRHLIFLLLDDFIELSHRLQVGRKFLVDMIFPDTILEFIFVLEYHQDRYLPKVEREKFLLRGRDLLVSAVEEIPYRVDPALNIRTLRMQC